MPKKIDRPTWVPEPAMVDKSAMKLFMDEVNRRFRLKIQFYPELHQWSVDYPEDFWGTLWDYFGVIHQTSAEKVLEVGRRFQETQWFLGAQLNFAENLLRYRDEHTALIFVSEDGQPEQMSYLELYQKVCAFAGYLKKLGVKPNDRVAGMLANTPHAVIAMLAATGLGAIWSACSPDFGEQGLSDRFLQIQPKIFIAVDGHVYNQHRYQHVEKIRALQRDIKSIEHTIIVNVVEKNLDLNHFYSPTVLWDKGFEIAAENFSFSAFPFDHPLYILYSSGTTGKPKCIVHRAGGVLLQHLKELKLHANLKRENTIFFYTTCTWMMWHWLISSLAVGATIVLYDGNPLPKSQPSRLFDLIDALQITHFGVSAKWIEMIEASHLFPRKTHSLASLNTILTTGSPLLPKSFEYVFKNIKSNIWLASISGGTDIISCFALGNPLLPVYPGEIQCLGLGMNVKIFNEIGESVAESEGELVCTTPFPSMPIYFWNDPTGEKYFHAYFDKFPGVWTHGDYAKITTHHGLIIYGRSDTTLNPGGIRIGTAEIYQQLASFKEIADCMIVGQNIKGDESIILFVVMNENAQLTEILIQAIKKQIKENVSPHHVPDKIIAAPDLPRTLNGKLLEIAVKKIINHQSLDNLESIANPASLEFFEKIKVEEVR